MFFDVYCKLCHEKGISPTGAALEMGISRGAVSAWKNGARIPNSAILTKISAYFGVSVDYLLGNEEKEKPTAEKAVSDEELKFALFGDATVSDEDFEDVKRFAEFIKNKKKE